MSGIFYAPADDPGQTASSAAISVAAMLIIVTLLLVGMKASGFRAMVAVGRG